jgi:hypothetical protein
VADSGVTRRLTVTSCKPLHSGTSAKGKPWTIFEVFAVDESGSTVEAKLRSFDPLPLNKLTEYKVTKREDRQHGTSYTLELPGKREPPPDPRVLKLRIDEQQTEIEGLKREVGALQAALKAFGEWASGLDSGVSPPDLTQLEAPASAALASDADIVV